MFPTITVEPDHLAMALILAVVAAGGWVYAVRARARARQEQAVARGARGFQLLVERSTDPVIIVDGAACITYVNPSAMAVFGYGTDRVGTSALEILHPDQVEDTVGRLVRAVDGDPLDGTILRRVRHGNGSWRWSETVSTNLLAEPSVAGIVMVLRDVTDRVQADADAVAEHVLTQTILDTTPALVVTAELDGRVLSFNRAAEDLTGYTNDEVVGQRWDRFVPAEELPAIQNTLAGLEPDRHPAAHENHWVTRSGDWRRISWTNAVIIDDQGKPERLVSTGVDVTEARKAEEAAQVADRRDRDRLAWDASHDPLTGLLNRAGLLAQLDRFLSGPPAQPVAVLFADLDDFKAVNDVHGHAAGDEVLRVVAQRLRSAVRADDVVGRLGGDEFVAVCPNLSAAGVATIADRIEVLMADPIKLGESTLRTGASVGTVVALEGDAAKVLASADSAMYAVKRSRPSGRRHSTSVTDTADRHVQIGAGRAGPSPGAPLHPEEATRLASLAALGPFEPGADAFIDTIVALAASVCATPIAAVSMIEADRQLFVSTVGLDAEESSRSSAFCAHTILESEHALVVDDATLDVRFQQNPFVTGQPNIRFYAGAPVAVHGQAPVGSLCVIDDRPRSLTRHQLESLERLRDVLVTYLELGPRRRTTVHEPSGGAERGPCEGGRAPGISCR